MPHETRVRDDDGRESLDAIETQLTTADTSVELAEAVEKVEELYDEAVNAADQTIEEDTGGWSVVSIVGRCHDAANALRANCLFLIECSSDLGVHWYEVYRSAGVEGEIQATYDTGHRHWRITAGDLAGGGTTVAGDLVDLIIASKP